jgi:hypothetical protein
MAGSPFEFPQAAGFGAAAPAGYAPAAPPVAYRHPLGLPAGSVRALLTFMVLGTVWTLLLMPAEKMISVPLYLYYLTFLVIGSYFGSRSHAPPGRRETPPLYLPRGSIRFLIIAGFLGVAGYGWYQDHEFLEKLRLDDMRKEPYLPFIIFGSFFLGVIVALVAHLTLSGPEGMPSWYQDVIAWISVIAVLALGGGVIYEVVIRPTMSGDAFTMAKLGMPWETILSGIVAFYFGVRS